MKRQTLKAILSVIAMAVMAHEAMAATTPPAQGLSHYSRVQLDTVDITVPGNGRWDGVSEAQRQQAVALTRESFGRATSGNTIPPASSANGTLHLSLTVEDVRPANTTRSVINHLMPIGLAANLSKSVAGTGASPSMGSVTIVGELRDARSGALVASFRSQASPDPMDLDAVLSQDAAMKAAIKRSAADFSKALRKAREGENPSTADCRLMVSPSAAG
ncbi:DUF3313 domain-containing protein [Niveibacterium sp. 24ML]|uniref:DUF3313 family protein n=1 Tax=Niveibacterium sp. 24ML TaxID=2985512 RepID=UPI00226DD61C|nr:DUF3313 family protein [Niveibacterium sp. 24ML]MCX9155830.1 DUF3313 domain-containing protein [Niveibacterium sp. 24ML]